MSKIYLFLITVSYKINYLFCLPTSLCISLFSHLFFNKLSQNTEQNEKIINVAAEEVIYVYKKTYLMSRKS